MARQDYYFLLIVSMDMFNEIIFVYIGLGMFQVPKYLAHVDRRLKEENDRLLHYLDQSTR